MAVVTGNRDKKQAIRNIIIFTVLVNGLAWLGSLLGGGPAEPGIGLLIWGTAPLLSALLMKWVVRDGVDMGWRPRLRGNGRWYALSLLIYPITMPLVLVIGLGLGASTWHGFTTQEFIAALLPMAVIYFLFALFEEVGWRGYLAPKMAEVNDRLAGHVGVGVIWASWHIPYLSQLLAHTAEGVETLLPRFVIGSIISAVVYDEIRWRTGTVWPAVLMHAVGNTLGNTLFSGIDGDPFVTLVPGKAWVGSFGVEGVMMMLIFGLVGGMLYWGRCRPPRAKSDWRAEQTA